MAKRASKKKAPDKGATMDGPTPPEHANLVQPKGSIECLGCGFVFAGRTNCPNCGYEMTDDQIKHVNELREKAGIPPSPLRR